MTVGNRQSGLQDQVGAIQSQNTRLRAYKQA